MKSNQNSNKMSAKPNKKLIKTTTLDNTCENNNK